MDDILITPRKTWGEWLSGFSPQVKAALIGAVVTIVLAVIPFFLYLAQNSRLKQDNASKTAKIQELELELTPFRTLAVEKYSKADAEAMKKLGEAMTVLQQNYSDALTTIASLQEQMRSARTEAETAKATAQKLEQRLADRVLTDAQLSAIADRLRAFSAQEYQITTFWNLKEPVAIANRIHKSLIAAGWLFKKPEPPTFLLEPMAGIRVWVHPAAEERTKQAANALVSVLSEQGMAAELRHNNAPQKPDNIINIQVGTKL
jgi:ribosomal 50S subunit-associated protein YjgA (DUF615 family)